MFKETHSDNFNSVFIFKLTKQLSVLLLVVFNKFETERDNPEDLMKLKGLEVKRVNRTIGIIIG